MNLKKALETKAEFQPKIENRPLLYTYIAPKDQESYDRFYSIAANLPTISMSIYEVLSNENSVLQILHESFSETTDFDIYIATKDIGIQYRFSGTLREYVVSMNINFPL